MKIIKRLFTLIIFTLFLLKSVYADEKISYQNCANKKETDKQSNYLNNWISLNSYDAILKEHYNNLKKHKLTISIIEEELNYLSKINFVELQDQYLKSSLELPFLTVLFGNHTYYLQLYDLQWDEFNDESKLEKRIYSDFFKDYEKTKTSLETKFKNHQILKKETVDTINELEKMGYEKYDVFLNKKINDKKNNLKMFLNKNLDDKMLNKSYNEYFLECEKERVAAPITFDYKWK